MKTTIIISDDNEEIADAIRKGTIEIVCSIGEDGPRIIKNRTHIDNFLIAGFLSNVRGRLNPTKALLFGQPNVELTGRPNAQHLDGPC
jgi:hypothetical protein